MKYICKHCKYQTDRADNYKRHLKTHSNERIKCQCGILLSEASIWRHKSNACSMKTTKETAQEPIQDYDESTNEKIVKIEAYVRVRKKDGQVWFDHDPIVVDDVELVMIPAASIVTMYPQSTEDAQHDVNLNGK